MPLQYWAIDGLPRENGKRQRKFFSTKDAAERELATDEYLKLQRLNQRSERHIGDLKYRLGTFSATFGPRLISELSVHEVEGWLHGLEQSPKSLNNFHTAVSALFSFAVKQSYASSNPLDAIDKVRVPAKAPGILSPDECAKLLNAAGSEILPSLAIQAFCGVRSAETLRLRWSDVDMTRGFVQVAAEHAKGAGQILHEHHAIVFLDHDSAG